MAVILQINHRHDVDESEARAIPPERAQAIAAQPGLEWKVWIRDPQTRTSGGVYLFADRDAAQKWATTLEDMLKQRPGVSAFDARIFEILDEPTRITRGPVPALARA
jgi:hypothetical protein